MPQHRQILVPSPTLTVHTPNAFLCRWGGSVGCTHVVEDNHSNLMLIKHLELYHGLDARRVKKNGEPDLRSRTSGKGLCRWEGCKRVHVENFGALLKHVRKGQHKRSMIL